MICDFVVFVCRRGSKEMIWCYLDMDCRIIKVVLLLYLVRILGYVEGIWSRYFVYCIVYVYVYIFVNVKESIDFVFVNNVIKM